MISEFDDDKLHNVIHSISYDPLSFSSNEFHLYGVEIESTETILWNPHSDEYKELPKSPNKSVDRIRSPYAFGYDYSAGYYKVICLDDVDDGSSVDVYTIGPNLWKSTRIIPHRMYPVEEPGVLLNGVFHWLGYMTDNYSDVIISLDISGKKFKALQPQKVSLEKKQCGLSAGVLKDCISVLCSGINVEVRVMQDYGVQESWTRYYTITHEGIPRAYTLKLMWSFSSGEILFATGGRYLADLVLYDPNDGSARKPNMHVENQIFPFQNGMNAIVLKA
ncbi:F-box/kelch-repeat protein At3g23880-like [Papaver somniferum]|uniref:F-box/kelch-repeat protein At3g23880-like n=1 Tax=Papaver somniferum TaxID=3469 RepID=UPI000E6F8044|nr:F-box/kelch-repeat protein At3g23880-like [Papaver somniferum]